MRFLDMKKLGQCQLNTLTGATDLTRNCLDAKSSNIQNIKENNINLPKTLNDQKVASLIKNISL